MEELVDFAAFGQGAAAWHLSIPFSFLVQSGQVHPSFSSTYDLFSFLHPIPMEVGVILPQETPVQLWDLAFLSPLGDPIWDSLRSLHAHVIPAFLYLYLHPSLFSQGGSDAPVLICL